MDQKGSPAKTFLWGTEVNEALKDLSEKKHKKQVVLVLEALAKVYPSMRKVICEKRGWSEQAYKSSTKSDNLNNDGTAVKEEPSEG